MKQLSQRKFSASLASTFDAASRVSGSVIAIGGLSQSLQEPAVNRIELCSRNNSSLLPF
jgi:hypothetical protein